MAVEDGGPDVFVPGSKLKHAMHGDRVRVHAQPSTKGRDGEVIDVVLLWWRDGDGDLVDAPMDAIGPLSDDGFVWVLSPKTGLPGHVEPSEIAESAPTAGLTQTSAQNLGDWLGSRLVQPKTQATKR